jgi:hypothetical protein
MEIIKGNLYKSKTSDLIVMAEEEKNEFFFSGQVVVGYGDGEKGKFSIGWIKEAFQPYFSEITIKEVIDFSKVQFLELNDGKIVFANGLNKEEKFIGTDLKTGRSLCFHKSEAKRVVTAKFE